MGLISPTRETAGQPRGGEEVDVSSVLTAILNLVNGNLDSANLADGGIAAADLAAGAKNLFPQLVSAADRKISFGSGSTAGFAGSVTQLGSVAHGLGRTPVAAFVVGATVATFSGIDSAVVFGLGTLDATNIPWRANIVNNSPSNNACSLWYLAIG